MLSAVTSAADRMIVSPEQVIHRVVLGERCELAGVHVQHGAGLQVPLHRDVVACGERIHVRLGAVDDDVDGLRLRRLMIHQIGTQPREVMLRTRRRRCQQNKRTRDRERARCEGQLSGVEQK